MKTVDLGAVFSPTQITTVSAMLDLLCFVGGKYDAQKEPALTWN